jgi:hypothetical protein
MGMMMAAAGLSAVGSLVSGIGGMESADYQAQVARNNALIAEQNATRAVQSGDVQATNQGLRSRAQLGTIKASQAGNNIDVNSGSAVDVQSSARQLGMLDALTIRNNAANQAYGYKVQAVSDKAQAQLDQMQGQTALESSLLGGASSLAGGYAKQGMYGASNEANVFDWLGSSGIGA